MKLFLVVNYYLACLSLKFHEDPSQMYAHESLMRTLAIKRACSCLQLVPMHLCMDL